MHNPSFYFITRKGIVIILKFYTIDINYIRYLYSFDTEVYFNKTRHDYEKKPYIGTIIFNDMIPYFIPLTSAKPKHLKLKNNGIDYLVIYENIDASEIHENDIIKHLDNATIKNWYLLLI